MKKEEDNGYSLLFSVYYSVVDLRRRRGEEKRGEDAFSFFLSFSAFALFFFFFS